MAREEDEARWELYLADAVEWFGLTGELPRGHEHASQWVRQRRSELRCGVPSLTPERIAKLDRSLPGWREKPSYRYQEWTVPAGEMRDFVVETQRLPRRSSDRVDERRLALWLKWERLHWRDRRQPRHHTEWLDEHVAEWRGGRRPRDEVWTRTVIDLGDWVRRAARLPSPRSDAPAERQFGEWLTKCRVAFRKGSLTPAQIMLLDDYVPGWSESRTATRIG